MKKRRGTVFSGVMGAAVWFLCACTLLALFFSPAPGLPAARSRSAILFLSFTVVYVLMTRVYGGFDIGRQKSRTIAFSMALVLLFSDLTAHLFLCILDFALIHQGRFVYEHPLRLLLAFLLQLTLTACLAWVGNRLFFRIARPLDCVMIVKTGGRHEDWDRKVELFRKQYRIRKIAWSQDPDVFDEIDGVDAVFLYDLTETERAAFVEYCYRKQKDLYYSVEPADAVMAGGKPVFFDDTAMIRVPADKLSGPEAAVKRVMDVVLSCAGLVLTSPILLAAAVAVRLEGGGPVLYRQPRATRNGQVFQILKFRSMRPETGDIHASVRAGDPRITRVGRFLRRYRIDELPQLWNVLRGDMSLVGPRPEMLENAERYTRELPQFSYRLRVRAGITGLAQVYGRYNTPPRDKLILDLLYIERFSLWLDIRILLRTLLVLLAPGRSTEGFPPEE